MKMKMRTLRRQNNDNNNIFNIVEWVRFLLLVIYCLGGEPAVANVTAADNDTITIVPTGIQPGSCESLHYDCESCLAKGCYWCTYDSLCFTTPELNPKLTTNYIKNYEILFPNKLTSCNKETDFTSTTCTAPDNFFSDPMYGGQNWIFDAINVVPVWERGYFGKGVRVRINDEGIDPTHPEFLNRIDANASCAADRSDGMGGSLNDGGTKHGMIVASIIGATGNNNNCGVGIAPEVTLSSCQSSTTLLPELLTYKLDQMDISQNSWAVEGCGPLSSFDPNRRRHRNLQQVGEEEGAAAAATANETTVLPEFVAECPFVYKPFDTYLLSPCDNCEMFLNHQDIDHELEVDVLGDTCLESIKNHCDIYYVKERNACMEYIDEILEAKYPFTDGECRFKTLTTAARNTFTKGVTEGRNGKGIIYIFAAGNENRVGDDTNFQGYGANTRMTIPVASVGKSGSYSGYSTSGASVFISAPGGDPRTAYTTVIAAANDGKCADGGDGTSFAAPMVSGVVALMLEANPNLGWRDVQDILARSAQVVNYVVVNSSTPDQTFMINSAEIAHSNRYGFGIIDANKSVTMSESWTNLGPEHMLVGEGSGEIQIFDYSSNPKHNRTIVNVTINSDEAFVTESVYVYLKLNHTSRGHLRIALTSPGEAGMISVLTPGYRPEDQTDEWMKFTTVRHWGENPNGEWIISLDDTLQGEVSNCSDRSDWQWELTDDFSGNDSYIDSEVLRCDFNHERLLERFCIDGQVDRTNSFYGQLCTTNVDKACDLLDKFETDTYNNGTNMKVTDACCICGGGGIPSLFPDYLFEWKVVVYGHNNTEAFLSDKEETSNDTGSSNSYNSNENGNSDTASDGIELSGGNTNNIIITSTSFVVGAAVTMMVGCAAMYDLL
mmetsp:Transcript_29477/g.33081  ORF Transcript_29477/g.33081 Transcript_29477/m.33081 type:complete len:892 (-) Transcript_29477:118-2793(-)